MNEAELFQMDKNISRKSSHPRQTGLEREIKEEKTGLNLKLRFKVHV